MKWIMQVIDGIDEPFSTRDILNNWDNYAPVRYKPQMNLLTNIVKQMVGKNLIVLVDKQKVTRMLPEWTAGPIMFRFTFALLKRSNSLEELWMIY